MIALKGEGLVKTYRDGRTETEVLRGVSLELSQGEIVAIEGPSGSGKTTLLQILGCILTPTRGTVEVAGHLVQASKERELAKIRRDNLGFVFQQFNLFPSLTAKENLAYSLRLKGWPLRDIRARSELLLEKVGLADRANFLPRDLSGGQKQRVAIARALGGRPAVLLADEPTANLDSQMGTLILHLFRDLAKQEGCGLLIVTHDPKVREISDRILRIQDGVIKDE